MNKNLVITNITLIADAAEYFDRKIGSAWKIRAAVTNMLVWAANRVITLEKNPNADRDQLVDARIVLATLRVWARDMNTTSLSLDLLHDSIRRTLGLDRVGVVREPSVAHGRGVGHDQHPVDGHPGPHLGPREGAQSELGRFFVEALQGRHDVMRCQ